MSGKLLKIVFSVLIILVSFFCGRQAKVENNAKLTTKAIRKKASPIFANQTSSPLIVVDKKDIVGLWTGSFDTTAEHMEVYRLYNDYINAIYAKVDEEGGEYYDDNSQWDGFFNTLDPKYKKYTETNAQFGYGYIISPNKLTIQISKIEDSLVEGKSICAGNERALKGKLASVTDNSWEIELNEPGDNKYDGIFRVTVSKNDSTAVGTYTPFDTAQTKKEFILHHRTYKYNKNAEWSFSSDHAYVEDFNPSHRELRPEDVENQPKSVLRLARNSIYARHGYSFKKKDVRNYFEQFADYIPLSADIRKELTPIEVKNESILKRYEEYSENFYDSYGR